jgi:predicted Zn-dependent protease
VVSRAVRAARQAGLDPVIVVLGHEAEHIDLGHCAERVQLEANLRHLHLGILGALASIPYEVFAAGYSKEKELAADRDGTQLAVAAGYSPMGAVRLFQTFARFEPGRRKAETPQEELSNLALESLQEYFRSHPRSEERVEKIQELIASRQWPLRAERELRIQYMKLNASVASALARHDYPTTKALAARSLALKPEQIAPLEAIYSASMYTGDFVSAADAARKLFAARPGSIPFAQRLAEALAAQRSGTGAAEEFERATSGHAQSSELERSLKTEGAGLRLLAGDDRAICEIADRVRSHPADPSSKAAGETLGRIGRWYYLAGNYDQALTTFKDARELDPAIDGIAANIGWAALQSNKLQTAQSSFGEEASSESTAGIIVGLWRMDEKEIAVMRESAITDDPKWKNERWVSAIYGPSIFQTLRDIDAERQRRWAARKMR